MQNLLPGLKGLPHFGQTFPAGADGAEVWGEGAAAKDGADAG